MERGEIADGEQEKANKGKGKQKSKGKGEADKQVRFSFLPLLRVFLFFSRGGRE